MLKLYLHWVVATVLLCNQSLPTRLLCFLGLRPRPINSHQQWLQGLCPSSPNSRKAWPCSCEAPSSFVIQTMPPPPHINLQWRWHSLPRSSPSLYCRAPVPFVSWQPPPFSVTQQHHLITALIFISDLFYRGLNQSHLPRRPTQ